MMNTARAVLTYYHRLLDRQTDGRPLVVMARSSIDERDKTKPKRAEIVE